VLDRDAGSDFVSIGTMSLSNKKFLVANIFFCCPVWALEAEKLSMLSGYDVENWSLSITEGNSYDS